MDEHPLIYSQGEDSYRDQVQWLSPWGPERGGGG
jgi:hypothetical protein